MASCVGCGQQLNPVEALHWEVCLPCTRARHKAVLKGDRCTCTVTERREQVVRDGLSKWVTCGRCLGFIRGRG